MNFRIITYNQANITLGLEGANRLTSPALNYCICKLTAIQKGANPTPLASFTYNRLIPLEKLTKLTYTVTFMSEGSQYHIENNVTPGSLLGSIKPAAPTKTGYTFVGWTYLYNGNTVSATDSYAINSNITFTALFSQIEYTINWQPGDDNTSNTNQTYAYGLTITAPSATYTKNGYSWDGWYNQTLGRNFDSGNDTALGNYTFIGKWTEVVTTTYTITWLDKDGHLIITSTVPAGDPISVPSLAQPYQTVTDYDFDGWYTVPGNSKLNPGVTTASGNVTYQAKFTPHIEMLAEVYWKLDSNGGGTLHGTAEAISSYENTTWLYNSTPQIHLNQRFEPMYRFNSNDSYYGGTELLDTQYATTNIATVAGVNIKPNDLDWDATIDWSNTTVNTTSGDNRSAYNMNIIFRTVNTDSSAITTITYSDSGVKTDDGSVHKGYGMAVSSTTTDQEMYWKDVIPVTYTAKYNLNGTYVTVFTLTMNIIIYSWNAFNVTSHNETGAPYYGNEPAVGTLVGGSQWASYGNSWLVNT